MSWGNTVTSLERRLSALGIYNTAAPGLRAELAAYEAGFAPLENEMERVFGNLFILTADSDEMIKRESLIRGKGNLTDEERRDFLMKNRRPITSAAADAQAMLDACGIKGKLTEKYGGDPYQIALDMSAVKGTDTRSAAERLRGMLPLHLKLTVVEK